MTSPTLEDLIDEVAAKATTPPHDAAVQAIRAIERRLVAALGGTTLRGLPNLGTSLTTLRGANVRTRTPEVRVSFPNDGQAEGPPALILGPNGQLAIAWTVRSSTGVGVPFQFTYRGAEDSDLRAEDLPALLTLLPKVLTNHLTRSEQSQVSWRELNALAHRVLDLLGKEG